MNEKYIKIKTNQKIKRGELLDRKSFNGKIFQQMTKVIKDLCLFANSDPGGVCPCPGAICIFFSKTNRPTKAELTVDHQFVMGTNVYINNPGNINNTATIRIYLKSF